MLERNLKCLRCSDNMKYISTQKLQLGQTGWLLGDLPNLIAGALEFDIYSCPHCGKVEFFQSENLVSKSEIQQVKCPKCGKLHDIDYPKCPFCKFSYIK